MEEVIISTLRSSRTIADEPTRLEVIAGEELDEKANMKPGDIRMVLNESTGIQTQQTSLTSGNALIRIQGLDGRYTQILRDGFPAFAGAAANLGILQTAPLDLKQVEVVKGSASTLYGGGAIAGLVNLISKTPQRSRELRFLLNGTTAGGLDISGFYGQQYGKAGLTVYVARNGNNAYDPAGIDLTAIPDFSRYTVSPKLFWKPTERTSVRLGVDVIREVRLGGDMHYVRAEEAPAGHTFFEENTTSRGLVQALVEHRTGDHSRIAVRGSHSLFYRGLRTRSDWTEGAQNNTFGEVTYTHEGGRAEWIVGATYYRESFAEMLRSGSSRVLPLDYAQQTAGAFVQSTWRISPRFILESGLRGDYVADYGFALLPRTSLLIKVTEGLTSRIGGGLGYKAPSPFTEQTERIGYANLLPISPATNILERSYGANWDVNYRTRILGGKVSLSVNQLFFYTNLQRPLLLDQDFPSRPTYQLVNIRGHFDSRGAETNIKLGYGDFKLFLGYTYTDAALHRDGQSKERYPLTPVHRLNNVLIWEHDEQWKVGLEAYYFGQQRLSDGATGRDYWVCGAMAERLWERVSVYINFENFLDARQTRWDTVYTGTLSAPVARDIYAPLDGFVANGGVKLRL